ncbi:anks1b, partial [Symbiodinium sp. CCMP2456]
MRCQDDWWNEVVDQLRDGQLSEKNHSYLHGRPVEGCTLSREACDKEAKVRWLQYHDMDTEGLCGMLPLAIGMPVALTHHVDRSEKLLLKGRVGYVHSWDWNENDQQPRVVHLSSTKIRYVKFEGADWLLEGAKEPGLYPTAVMLDLNVDSKTHAAYGTVVASRVRNRSDLLILRPFPLWLFQRGATE